MKKISGTIRQAMEASGLGLRKLYDHMQAGTLKSVRVGRRRLILWDSLEALINNAPAGITLAQSEEGRSKHQRRGREE